MTPVRQSPPVQPLHEYYESLAATYDDDRFGNSYGRYVDRLERRLLRDWLSGRSPATAVDLGCGTGRLLDFALTGVDGSGAMLDVASRKRPRHQLVLADIRSTGLASASFDSAFCFHVLMHLDEQAIRSVIAEAARIVRRGGRFIVDVPSSARRALGAPRPEGWHAGTAGSLGDIERWAGPEWFIRRWRGLMAFPIHRVPSRWRAYLSTLDELICRTPCARWASYLAVELERR